MPKRIISIVLAMMLILAYPSSFAHAMEDAVMESDSRTSVESENPDETSMENSGQNETEPPQNASDPDKPPTSPSPPDTDETEENIIDKDPDEAETDSDPYDPDDDKTSYETNEHECDETCKCEEDCKCKEDCEYEENCDCEKNCNCEENYDYEENSDGEENLYAALEIFKVTLPTADTLDFVLDPLGLATLGEGESIILGESKGLIYPTSPHPATVLNESSIPLKLTVDLMATTVSGGGRNNDRARFVRFDTDFNTTKASVFEGNGLNVLLYAVPNRHTIRTAFDNFIPSDHAYVVTESGIRLTFILPEAIYEPIDEYGNLALVSGTGSGIQIRVGGYVNNTADWSNFTDNHDGPAASSVGVRAVFTLSRLDDEDIEPAHREDIEPTHREDIELTQIAVMSAAHITDTIDTQPASIVLDRTSLDALIIPPLAELQRLENLQLINP